MRDHYEALMARPDDIEDILLVGASKARAVATPFLHDLRAAVGLGRLVGAGSGRGCIVPNGPATPTMASASGGAVSTPGKPPLFKQYRESDGRFYFKLTTHDGSVLLQSEGFDGGRDAGQWVKRIRTEGLGAAKVAPVVLGTDVTWAAVDDALHRLMEEDAQLAAGTPIART
jgi:tryptophanyl-tRNA synthetase